MTSAKGKTPVTPSPTSSTSSSSSTSATVAVADDKDYDTQSDEKKIKELIYYCVDTPDDDLKDIYENVRYKGFDRKEMLKRMSEIPEFRDKRVITEVIIICALNGPQRAAQTIIPKLQKTLSQIGIPASGGKSTKKLTCARITASTADLAAFFLKKLDVPKRINVECPGWLQFPAAGSISLSDELRKQHKEFLIKFSSRLINKQTGTSLPFSEQIYENMVQNSYCDPRIRFD